jgi:hypothetical protein
LRPSPPGNECAGECGSKEISSIHGRFLLDAREF